MLATGHRNLELSKTSILSCLPRTPKSFNNTNICVNLYFTSVQWFHFSGSKEGFLFFVFFCYLSRQKDLLLEITSFCQSFRRSI